MAEAAMTAHEILESLVSWVVVKAAAVGAVVGLVVAFLRGLIERKYGSIGEWVAALAAAVLVGAIASLLLHEVDMADTLKGVLIAGSGFIADDVLRGLKVIGAGIATDPLGSWQRILDALRGGGRKDPPS
jgi:hypothetical protein